MVNASDPIQAAKLAAREFSKRHLNDGFSPAGFYIYRDLHGNPLYYRYRLEHSDGRKVIRPMHQNTTGNFEMSEAPLPQNSLKPLYDLFLIAQYPTATLYLVEGEKLVDALNRLFAKYNVADQYIAVTSGGANTADTVDWQPLASRNIIAWADNDDPGTQYIATAAEMLHNLGCTVSIINIALLELPPKGDVVDWLDLHPTATIDELLALPMIESKNTTTQDVLPYNLDDSDEKQSHASALVTFVIEEVELFHDQNGEVYGQYKSTKEVHRIDSRRFKDWLVASFFLKTQKSIREQSVREAINTLSGLARSKGKCHEVNIRVATHNGNYYLDLAEPGSSHTIELTPAGWSIIDNPPVYFLRPETMRPLPCPSPGGDITSLWGMVNIPENCRYLVLTWLIDSFRPESPFAILELFGEQGSAKSSTQRILRRLIDPNSSDLRAAPRTPEDIFVCAGVNWLASYENISHLSAPMQDALCTLSTGAGFAKRKLYSDAEESVIQVKRPIILNGISVTVTAQDLVDRTISIETPTINDRVEGTELFETFEAIQGDLLGALLSIAAKAFSVVKTMQLPPAERPRMIEFAHLGMAIAHVLEGDPQAFLEQFNTARQESIARTIEASPVALALIEWIQEQSNTVEKPAKDLLEALEKYKPGNTESWPRSPKGLADGLRKIAPALRQMGIECQCTGKRGSNVYWKITPPPR